MTASTGTAPKTTRTDIGQAALMAELSGTLTPLKLKDGNGGHFDAVFNDGLGGKARSVVADASRYVAETKKAPGQTEAPANLSTPVVH